MFLTFRIVVFAALGVMLCAGIACAGPPFKTDDPQPVDFRHWEFYVASEQSFQRVETDATLPHVEVNYGVIPDVQLHLVAPLGYARTTAGAHYGYSDTEIGVKYRFIQESEAMPQVGVFPMVELPTGNQERQLGAGMTQVYLPAWIQKSWGKLTTYGGAGYWYNPGSGRKNWVFAGWQAQYDFSEALTLGGEIYYQTADADDASASAGGSIGGFINFGEHHHLLFSVGALTTAPSTFTGYVGYQLTI